MDAVEHISLSIPTPSRVRDFKRGSVYHIFQRGNYKKKVFRTWPQLAKYRTRLFYLAKRYRVRIHTFCFMENHIHLVLEPLTKTGISCLMRDLQSGHSRMMNHYEGIRGNLWQQNYGYKLVHSPAYYKTLLWYVETNPVKAGLVKRAEDYEWSGAQVHVAGTALTYKWEEPHGFKTKPAYCTVSLYLTRWKKEFGDVNWSDYLKNPGSRVPTEELTTLEKFVGDAILQQLHDRAMQRRAQQPKGRGGNQFAKNSRQRRAPQTTVFPASIPKSANVSRAG